MVKTPWAILRFKFADETVEHWPREHYERLFTSAGAGSMNMTDYFSEMSQGMLDLSDSKVFGWFSLPIPRSDYEVPPKQAGKLGRGELVALCNETVANTGLDLSSFPYRLYVLNSVETEFYGSPAGAYAVCDSTSLMPAILGHEMGHGYGLEHSRQDGWEVDYKDPWDVMSAADTAQVAHPEYESAGPGVNAVNMRRLGWLDEARVYVASATSTYETTVELRPLHRPELAGPLAVQLGEFLVEYRPKQRWDAGFERSFVFVHRLGGLHSYVMKGSNGYSPSFSLPAGGSFSGDPHSSVTRYSLDVEEIDDAAQIARLRIKHSIMPVVPPWLVEILAGIAPDGGGIIFWGGKIIKVPPSPPILFFVKQLLNLLEADEVGGGIASVSEDPS